MSGDGVGYEAEEHGVKVLEAEKEGIEDADGPDDGEEVGLLWSGGVRRSRRKWRRCGADLA